MSNYIEPLDFETIFLQYFIGNNILFFYVFLIIFSLAAAKFQMSNRNYYILLGLGSIMFAVYLEAVVYFLAFFFIGFFLFKVFSKLLE